MREGLLKVGFRLGVVPRNRPKTKVDLAGGASKYHYYDQR